MNIKERVKHYRYHVHWSEEDEAFVAKVTEWPSLGTHGDTMAGALEEMEDLLVGLLEEMEAEGEPYPMPLSSKSYSGKFVVRIPPRLHAELVVGAAEQGVSLNQYVTLKLAR